MAAAYNKKYFVGKVTSFEEGDVCINFLARKRAREYKWPKSQDIGTFNPYFIFHSNVRIQQVGSVFVLNNEEQIVKAFEAYKKKYL